MPPPWASSDHGAWACSKHTTTHRQNHPTQHRTPGRAASADNEVLGPSDPRRINGRDHLARIRSEDKDLFTRTRRAVALLAEQPYPEDAVAWGGTGVYRLHAGDIRVLYEVDDEAATVYIINIGIIS